MRDKLKEYIELVDKAILINDEKIFIKFCAKHQLDRGLCHFGISKEIIDIGRKIINKKYMEIYYDLSPNKANWWFWYIVIDRLSFDMKKRSLLARQQVVKDILEIYYPNNIIKLILNLWKRF